MKLLPVLAALLMGAVGHAAQTQVLGTARISGTVVTDEASPQPVRRARVSAQSIDGRHGLTVVSDDSGRFVLDALPAGRYLVSATRPAFVRGVLGARVPGGAGVPLTIADAAHSTGHEIRMLRGSVITGVLRDGKGRVLPGLTVTLSRLGYKDGRRTRIPDAGTAVTDDQGVYRLFGLKPGEYFVSVVRSMSPDDAPIVPTRQEDLERARGRATGPLQPAPGLTAPTTFFPGVVSPADALPVRVGRAEERSGVDFTVDLYPTHSVSVTVLLPDGRPAPPNVRTIVRRVNGDDENVGTLAPRASGFTIYGLVPGDYVFRAEAADPAGPSNVMGLSANAVVQVGQQSLTDVTLQLTPSMSVAGRVVFEGVADADRPSTEVAVRLQEAFVNRLISSPSGRATTDGRFTIPGVSPRRYHVMVGTPSGWSLKSIRREQAKGEGVDLADVPFVVEPGESPTDLVVTFTKTKTELRGALSDEAGRAATDFHIVVFSTDRRYWISRSRRIQAVRPASDGAFVLTGLPEGSYLIAALTDLEEGEWFDPALLDSLVAGAIKIELAAGKPVVQQIRIAGGH